ATAAGTWYENHRGTGARPGSPPSWQGCEAGGPTCRVRSRVCSRRVVACAPHHFGRAVRRLPNANDSHDEVLGLGSETGHTDVPVPVRAAERRRGREHELSESLFPRRVEVTGHRIRGALRALQREAVVLARLNRAARLQVPNPCASRAPADAGAARVGRARACPTARAPIAPEAEADGGGQCRRCDHCKRKDFLTECHGYPLVSYWGLLTARKSLLGRSPRRRSRPGSRSGPSQRGES